MACLRCNYDFCWSCMSKEGSCAVGGFPLCPRLPYSMCTNLTITLVAFLLAPLVLSLGPILVGIIYGIFVQPYHVYQACKRNCCGYRRNCLQRTGCILVSVLVSWLLLLPLVLSLAAIVSALAGTIGTLVFEVLCLVYIARLTKNTVKGSCKGRR